VEVVMSGGEVGWCFRMWVDVVDEAEKLLLFR
jgi:hypothetical protein